ncbi:PAS domain S-box-containing protein/diguanylate cyclase (GGDEF) domain-containing protein [Malonomonas rubra DSM 5091]|uniref:PAS domain S-box-containing protein/diguanylate cyclase (GGDEF) domain-containing protein n=1 Tax=Malonomonas rubra DSM 5091 TaxID=1122189 RepID=A0A1M6CHU7_MALRU|nr:diguanylate cyclase [Malonomonas rubra]SHI60493.1 PAS domain S-box-containing protein/diguanylate cyclase (GGDEF) domain-containing protein [Malonomonas rubra DSM 5091]
MARFSSIRSKIWLCVLTALGGFFVSVVVGFYVNISQYSHLSHLQTSYWPLVSGSEKLHDIIKRQNNRYEDAFLFGEQDLAQQSIAMQVSFVDLLDDLMIWVQSIDNSPVTVKNLLMLKRDYIRVMRLAVELRPTIVIEDLSLEQQRRIQEFGQLQHDLQARVEEISLVLNNEMIKVIEGDKKRVLSHLMVLGVLFLLGFAAAILTVNRVASTLLVAPLSRVLANVRRLESGYELEPPTLTADNDEIAQLAIAFWGMGEKLKRTTVSKRYVDNIISNMSGGLVVLKPDLTIDKVSQQTLKLFGYSEDELIGQPADLLSALDDDSILSPERLEELLNVGLVKQAEMTCVGRDGLTFPAHFSGSAMYGEDGELIGIIGILNDITELKKAQNELIQMAHHDSLTGLPNRNLLFDRLERTLQDAKRHNRTFALLYLDLDRFKEINDTMGHDVGDMVLKEVSNRLLQLLRADDTVARMGGDEFLIILNALQSPEDAGVLAKKVVEGLCEPFSFGTIEHRLGVSAGISIFPQDGTAIETLIKKSDSAMYVSKNSGGSCFNFS